MSEAPERIWMDPDIKFPECEKRYGCDIEYVRADLVEELEAKLAKAVEAADGMLDAFCIHETQQQSVAYDNMCAALAAIKGGDTT